MSVPTLFCQIRDEKRTMSRPGSRKDKFTVQPAQMLAYLEREREKAETDLAIQREIHLERQKLLATQIELADARKECLFSTK
jgi:hypothetical protein